MRIALMLAAAAVALVARAQAPASARLAVEISGLRNDNGRVGCLLFASRSGFPTEPSRAFARAETTPHSRRCQCVFESLPPGTYAVAVHHDEDGDGIFDTGIFGIPLEGIGASRDARGSTGPPSFGDARIDVPPGETQIAVHVYYPM